MTPNAIVWETPALSTGSVEAVINYREGITALVSGIAHADALLTTAVALDPDFLLARVGLAVCAVVRGERYAPPTTAGTVGRAERQHAEIVATALSGDGARAGHLRREHLLEFPGDLLIVWLPVLERCERS